MKQTTITTQYILCIYAINCKSKNLFAFRFLFLFLFTYPPTPPPPFFLYMICLQYPVQNFLKSRYVDTLQFQLFSLLPYIKICMLFVLVNPFFLFRSFACLPFCQSFTFTFLFCVFFIPT